MKRNKPLRIAAIILALVLVSTCGMVGTLAKYVDTFAVTAQTVRAGLFKVDGPGASQAIFDTVLYEGNATATETNAKAYTGLAANKNIIVPGSVIKVLGLTITNYSEVDVTVSVTAINITTAIPGLMYSLTGNGTDWSATLPIAAQLVTGGTVDLDSYPKASAGSNTTTTKGFYILWPFAATSEGSPGVDAKDGNLYTVDTPIGKAQATALLSAGVAEVPCTNDGSSIVCDDPSSKDPADHDAGCAFAPATDVTYTDVATTNIISVGATVTAVQKD